MTVLPQGFGGYVTQIGWSGWPPSWGGSFRSTLRRRAL